MIELTSAVDAMFSILRAMAPTVFFIVGTTYFIKHMMK